MKNKIKLSVFLLILNLFFNCGTNDWKSKNFDYGKVENNVYINSFFNFNLTLPSGWIVQSKEQTKKLSELGKKLVAGNDKNLEVVLKASEVNVANLLVIFQYEPGAAVDYNPSLSLVAENLKSSPGVKTGKDYLFHARKLLKQSAIKYYYIDEEPKKELINNQEFYMMNCKINYMGQDINQYYYSTIRQGFCILVIISFINENQKNDLVKVVNSINFNN